MTRWNTRKQFSSFLRALPEDDSISGGKVLRTYPHAKFTIELPMRCGCARKV